MTVFEMALKFVLKEEGADTNDPNDPGGFTHAGLSSRALPGVDVATLTADQIVEIYRNRYWNSIRCEELPPAIAFMMFNSCVNQGPHAAAFMLQSITHLPTDGIVGSQTVQAARTISEFDIITNFATAQILRYADNQQFGLYAKGWVSRTFRAYFHAVTLIGSR